MQHDGHVLLWDNLGTDRGSRRVDTMQELALSASFTGFTMLLGGGHRSSSSSSGSV